MRRSVWDVEFVEGDRVRLADPDTALDRQLVGSVLRVRLVERFVDVDVQWDDGGKERFDPEDLRLLDAVERLAELA